MLQSSVAGLNGSLMATNIRNFVMVSSSCVLSHGNVTSCGIDMSHGSALS